MHHEVTCQEAGPLRTGARAAPQEAGTEAVSEGREGDWGNEGGGEIYAGGMENPSNKRCVLGRRVEDGRYWLPAVLKEN